MEFHVFWNWDSTKFSKPIIVFTWTIIWNWNFLLGAIDLSCESIWVRSRMNAAAGMKTASISASPRRVNQLPVSFSFVTPCVSPFSLNHSSKRFDSCRLRRRTSYSSHLPIDFSQFYQSHSSYRSLRTEKKIIRFVVSVTFRDFERWDKEEWIDQSRARKMCILARNWFLCKASPKNRPRKKPNGITKDDETRRKITLNRKLYIILHEWIFLSCNLSCKNGASI